MLAVQVKGSENTSLAETFSVVPLLQDVSNSSVKEVKIQTHLFIEKTSPKVYILYFNVFYIAI
jgi:hypothetical protein